MSTSSKSSKVGGSGFWNVDTIEDVHDGIGPFGNVDAYDADGWTALHAAFYSGSTDVASFLVDQFDADPSLVTRDLDQPGRTILHMAALSGFTRSVDLALKLSRNEGIDLIAVSSESGQTPLWCAASIQSPAVVRRLLENGSPLVYRYPTQPIHEAARAGCLGTIDVLLEHGADINELTASKMTPMAEAILSKQFGLIEPLKQTGALLHLEGAQYSVLHRIVFENEEDFDPEMIRAVHRERPDLLNLPDPNGNRPLHLAVTEGRPDIVRVLIELGASVKCRNDDGCLPAEAANHPDQTAISNKALRTKRQECIAMIRSREAALSIEGILSSVGKQLNPHDEPDEASHSIQDNALLSAPQKQKKRPRHSSQERRQA
jgi:ankyrin repeat protein